MFESLFRTLFKYERLVFEQGQFVMGATQSMWLVAAITAAAALYVLWTYQQLTALRWRDKVVLSAMRVALLQRLAPYKIPKRIHFVDAL